MIVACETSQKWCETMTDENRELSVEELASVAGGGLVDNVLPESEASTAEFLKRFAEAAQRFQAFLNRPTGAAAASQD
jgi:hypothetical protein